MVNGTAVKYSVRFSKKGDMAYISHLDLMRLFRRAIRRADLPFVLTGGFTPRVKISMPKALKLGKESDQEEMQFWLAEEKDRSGLSENLNRELPPGVRVISCE
ncbi:MAG: TIGR03936 family radical SAM-associated protein [Candidatus Omnitrophica bacterium]|nr:TIGR03936 family radical SAM-associated protein [Candidatus Omnitrophota bacterium]